MKITRHQLVLALGSIGGVVGISMVAFGGKSASPTPTPAPAPPSSSSSSSSSGSTGSSSSSGGGAGSGSSTPSSPAANASITSSASGTTTSLQKGGTLTVTVPLSGATALTGTSTQGLLTKKSSKTSGTSQIDTWTASATGNDTLTYTVPFAPSPLYSFGVVIT